MAVPAPGSAQLGDGRDCAGHARGQRSGACAGAAGSEAAQQCAREDVRGLIAVVLGWNPCRPAELPALEEALRAVETLLVCASELADSLRDGYWGLPTASEARDVARAILREADRRLHPPAPGAPRHAVVLRARNLALLATALLEAAQQAQRETSR